MKIVNIDDSYSGKRLDRFLIGTFPRCSKNLIYRLIRQKKIKINNKKCDEKYILKQGDKIYFYISDLLYHQMLEGNKKELGNLESINGGSEDEKKHSEKNEIQDPDLNRKRQSNNDVDFFLLILYEDDSIIILQKPSSMVVHEDLQEKKWVLQRFLFNYLNFNYLNFNGDYFEHSKKTEILKNTFKNKNSYKEIDKKNIVETDFTRTTEEEILFPPSPVHRLDRNTEGAVIFAKTYRAFIEASELIKRHKVQKEYIAIVYGRINNEKKFTLNLIKDSEKNIVRVQNSPDSKIAITLVQPLAFSKETTLVRVIIETGRTHQIRITLANNGTPIVGDSKYGIKRQFADFQKRYDIREQMLFAYSIKFPKLDNSSIQALSNKRICAKLPDIWLNIFEKEFGFSETEFEELLQNLRK